MDERATALDAAETRLRAAEAKASTLQTEVRLYEKAIAFEERQEVGTRKLAAQEDRTTSLVPQYDPVTSTEALYKDTPLSTLRVRARACVGLACAQRTGTRACVCVRVRVCMRVCACVPVCARALSTAARGQPDDSTAAHPPSALASVAVCGPRRICPDRRGLVCVAYVRGTCAWHTCVAVFKGEAPREG